MADDFCVNSIYFLQLLWKTSILCRPGGLEELKGAVEILVCVTLSCILAGKQLRIFDRS
jgi:hypothetical protein